MFAWLKDFLASGITVTGTILQANEEIVFGHYLVTKFVIQDKITGELHGGIDFRHPVINPRDTITVFLSFEHRFPPLNPEIFIHPQTRIEHLIKFKEVDY